MTRLNHHLNPFFREPQRTGKTIATIISWPAKNPDRPVRQQPISCTSNHVYCLTGQRSASRSHQFAIINSERCSVRIEHSDLGPMLVQRAGSPPSVSLAPLLTAERPSASAITHSAYRPE
jgi:hypothetical protein